MSPCVATRTLPCFTVNCLRITPQKQLGRPNHSRGTVADSASSCYGGHSGRRNYGHDDLKHPSSIVSIPKEWGHEAWHPTQKPVELIRWLVRTYTSEGDTVLDNCMGSGTTAIACLMEKRRFIGFETNGEYWKKANDRIADFRKQSKQLELF